MTDSKDDTDYDKIFDLSKHPNPNRYNETFCYLNDDDLDEGEEYVIEYELRVYNESNAQLVKEVGIKIPDKPRSRYADQGYQTPFENKIYDEDTTGHETFEESLGTPGVIFYLEVLASEEEEFLLSITKLLEVMPQDMGGLTLFRSVEVQDSYGHTVRKYKEYGAYIIEPIPAKNLEEHKRWCDMTLADYQGWFPEIQADPTSVRMRCPKCGIGSEDKNPQPDWYARPDFTDIESRKECPRCYPQVVGFIVDEP
jgi:hypothetical protein